MRRFAFALWFLVAAATGVWFGAPYAASGGAVKLRHLPGTTTSGHHAIEEACDACHRPFGGVENDACTGCHGAALATANDSYAESKFADPRNAERVARLDATRCSTCHREHEGAQAVTLPKDFCGACHATIAEERPSHRGFAPEGCANAGCHNFHDNRGLYEDFLGKHLGEPRLLPARPAAAAPKKPCDRGADCRGCHAPETRGFDAGKHGMRAAAGLGPMRTSLARLPMTPGDKELSCTSCHDGAAARAATDACLGCHTDEHSVSFKATPHFATGVTCATCHMPGGDHDQSQNLRPANKMARDVCMTCHGAGFVLDAFAKGSVPTLEMVGARKLDKERR